MALRFAPIVGALVALLVVASSLQANAGEVRYTVYFDRGTVQLPGFVGSELIVLIAKDIKSNAVSKVVLTGHCDTSEQAPTVLSRYRAKTVADELRKNSVPESVAIEWAGAGVSDLAVPTAANIREPLNRRVTVVYE